jgi:hypothetical protein
MAATEKAEDITWEKLKDGRRKWEEEAQSK